MRMSAQTSNCQQTADSHAPCSVLHTDVKSLQCEWELTSSKAATLDGPTRKIYCQADLVYCLLQGDATVLQFLHVFLAPGPEPVQTHSKLWALSVGEHKMQRITLSDDPLLTQDSPDPGV